MDAKKKRRLYIAAGVVSIFAVIGVFGYIQYKKLMDYCIGVKRVQVNNIGLNNINFNIWFTFLNKSNVTFTLISQTYKVYLNDKYITTLSNKSPNVVKSEQTSEIALNVDINPKSVFKEMGMGVFDMAMNYKKIMVKLDMKMKVKVLGITVSVPYVYEDTLEAMFLPDPKNKSDENKESEC
jgi:LEA14-like dessication related protein